LGIVAETRHRLGVMKQEKLNQKFEKYKDYHVDCEVLLHGFLEELGEFLVAYHLDKEPKLEKMEEELIDLSNQVDFLYAYVRWLRSDMPKETRAKGEAECQ